ncbi:MAG: fumarylacetoacetate hydrolase family protein, partial [Gaiellaceae bacterium]
MNGAVGFGVFSAEGGSARVGFRVGHGVLDLAASGLGPVFETSSLNGFLGLGRSAWEDALGRVAELVEAGAEVVPLEHTTVHLPFEVADYVDFYSSLEHASNLGRLFRPDADPLLPNWRHLPVGYHGRAGTVVVSGTPVVRPCGQMRGPEDATPRFGPSARLDLELELGFVVGVGSDQGESVPGAAFRDHVFGVVLVNDWSARDIQAWEYQPLGPFLGKSFATSISAWITPLALLDDSLVAGPEQDPEPLPYLRVPGDWALDAELEVEIGDTVVSRTNARG